MVITRLMSLSMSAINWLYESSTSFTRAWITNPSRHDSSARNARQCWCLNDHYYLPVTSYMRQSHLINTTASGPHWQFSRMFPPLTQSSLRLIGVFTFIPLSHASTLSSTPGTTYCPECRRTEFIMFLSPQSYSGFNLPFRGMVVCTMYFGK